MLDDRFNFDELLERLKPRVEELALHLCHLLSNVGGPELKVRRLYVNVLKSKELYGASVWAVRFMKEGVMILFKIQ